MINKNNIPVNFNFQDNRIFIILQNKKNALYTNTLIFSNNVIWKGLYE